MAIDITAYVFSKRSNSTKQPDTSGTDFSVSLKAATSYENPTFILNYSGTFEYNYMQWGSWYYFVTSVTQLRNDLLEINCKLDVLATFKAEIGATSAFVLYDTVANTEVVDRRISNKTSTTKRVNTVESDLFVGEACVVCGITGRYDSGLFAMPVGTARELLSSINNWMDEAEAIPWPEFEEEEEEPTEPGSGNDEDPNNGPGV